MAAYSFGPLTIFQLLSSYCGDGAGGESARLKKRPRPPWSRSQQAKVVKRITAPTIVVEPIRIPGKPHSYNPIGLPLPLSIVQ